MNAAAAYLSFFLSFFLTLSSIFSISHVFVYPLRVGITQRLKSVGAGRARGGRRKLFVLRMYQGMGLGAKYALGLMLWGWGYCLHTRSGGAGPGGG